MHHPESIRLKYFQRSADKFAGRFVSYRNHPEANDLQEPFYLQRCMRQISINTYLDIHLLEATIFNKRANVLAKHQLPC